MRRRLDRSDEDGKEQVSPPGPCGKEETSWQEKMEKRKRLDRDEIASLIDSDPFLWLPWQPASLSIEFEKDFPSSLVFQEQMDWEYRRSQRLDMGRFVVNEMN